jgi:hypothetical protein
MWLGKVTREEAATELGLSTLRLWQLSQQAVAGLVAGCLKQPRFRRGRSPAGEAPEEGVGVLRKKIAALERELDSARRLIGILKDLPVPRAAAAAPSAERGDGGSRGRRKCDDARPAADAGGARSAGTEAARDAAR